MSYQVHNVDSRYTTGKENINDGEPPQKRVELILCYQQYNLSKLEVDAQVGYINFGAEDTKYMLPVLENVPKTGEYSYLICLALRIVTV